MGGRGAAPFLCQPTDHFAVCLEDNCIMKTLWIRIDECEWGMIKALLVGVAIVLFAFLCAAAGGKLESS